MGNELGNREGCSFLTKLNTLLYNLIHFSDLLDYQLTAHAQPTDLPTYKLGKQQAVLLALRLGELTKLELLFCVAGSPGERLLTGAASSGCKNPRSVFTDPGCRSERTAELVVAAGYCTARPVSAWALRAKASEKVLQVPEELPTVSVPCRVRAGCCPTCAAAPGADSPPTRLRGLCLLHCSCG